MQHWLFAEQLIIVFRKHTPPEEWVRAKKFCITFDTNFSRYLPRGTIIDGSRKCRIGAFCTIAKISGEMPKKGLKTGQNGVKFFWGPSHMLNNNICSNFLISIFFILVLIRPVFRTNFHKIVLKKAPKWKMLKIKKCHKCY